MPERFTETFIKGLKPPTKGARWEWDSELTGFLVRIFAPAKPICARFLAMHWEQPSMLSARRKQLVRQAPTF